jgi:hypothetical protein
MKYQARGLLFLAIFILSCARPLTSPPPPSVFSDNIAVLPPNNRTGDPLVFSSSWFGDPYGSSANVTVPNLVAAEARLQLQQRGLAVLSPETVEAAIGTHPPGSPEEAADLATRGKLEGHVLYIEIKRWEPGDMSTVRPKEILVALEASLIEATSGRVVWTTHWQLRPVPTSGAINAWSADQIAAHAVVEQLLASWQGVPPPGGS